MGYNRWFGAALSILSNIVSYNVRMHEYSQIKSHKLQLVLGVMLMWLLHDVLTTEPVSLEDRWTTFFTTPLEVLLNVTVIGANMDFHPHGCDVCCDPCRSLSCFLCCDWLWPSAGSESGRSSPYYGQDGRSTTPTTIQPPKHFHVPGRTPLVLIALLIMIVSGFLGDFF